MLHSHLHIYKANKSRQLKKISEDTGIPLNEMIFFDNQSNNCLDVSKVNVTVAYVPDGITRFVEDLIIFCALKICAIWFLYYGTILIIHFSGAHSRML